MTKTLTHFLTTSAMSLALSFMAEAQERHVVIGLDLSSSTPLSSDLAYAERAAKHVDALLDGLQPGDRVSLRTAGDYGPTANAFRYDWDLSRRMPVIKVRRSLQKLISNLPRVAGSEKLPIAKTTNLIGFLELESYAVDCANRSTEFLLLTDGVEWSSLTNGKDLTTGAAQLPVSDTDGLQGCGLTMLGIGQLQSGASPTITSTLIKAWRAWASKVGMRFTPRPSL